MSVRSYAKWSRFDARSQGCKTLWEHQIEERVFPWAPEALLQRTKTRSFVETRSCTSNKKVFRSEFLGCTCHDTRILNTDTSCQTFLSSFGSILVPNIKVHFSCKLEKTEFAFEKEKCLKVVFFDTLPSIRLYSRQVAPLTPFWVRLRLVWHQTLKRYF